MSVRLYFKKSDELLRDSKFFDNKSDWAVYELSGETLYGYESSPYVNATSQFSVFKYNELYEKHFLQATLKDEIEYSKIRDCGIYYFGDAKVTLSECSKSSITRSVHAETSSWKGIADMEILLEKIQAGSIAPQTSFGVEQVQVSRLQILFQTVKEILTYHNLSAWKRFILALRLTRG